MDDDLSVAFSDLAGPTAVIPAGLDPLKQEIEMLYPGIRSLNPIVLGDAVSQITLPPAVGKLFEIYGGGVSGSACGFLFALMTTFAWPRILPDFIWNWMDR